MFTINLAKTKTVTIDFDAMPEAARNHIIEYGLKQKLNDAGASITSEEVPDPVERAKQKVAVAETVLEALMRGEVTVRQARAGMSPLEAEIAKQVKATYKKLFKAKLDDDADGIALIATKLERTEEAVLAAFTKKAETALEEARKIAAIKASTVQVDLTDLL